MKYQICLINIIVLLFMFTGCTKVQIIWHDYMNNDNPKPVVLKYTNKNQTKVETHNLVPRKTKSFFRQNDLFLGQEHDSSFCMHYYSNPKKINIIEIFIFNTNDVSNTNGIYKVKAIDGVLAYYLDCYDERLEKNCTIISKDNVFEITKIELENKNDTEKIFKIIDNRDYAYYEKDYNKYFKTPFYGFIVKSQIDGSYIWLSSYNDE